MGVFSVKSGAVDPTGSRFAFDGGLAADAGWLSIVPTPASVLGEKPTESAAFTSEAGAFLSAAEAAAGGGAFGEDLSCE